MPSNAHGGLARLEGAENVTAKQLEKDSIKKVVEHTCGPFCRCNRIPL